MKKKYVIKHKIKDCYWTKNSEYDTAFYSRNCNVGTIFTTKKAAEKAIKNYCIKDCHIVEGYQLDTGFHEGEINFS